MVTGRSPRIVCTHSLPDSGHLWRYPPRSGIVGFPEAWGHLQQSLAVYERLKVPDSPEIANVLVELGELRLLYDEAGPSELARAIKILEKRSVDDPESYVRALTIHLREVTNSDHSARTN